MVTAESHSAPIMQGTDTQRVLPKLAVLVLVLIALGLPINNLYVFALLAAGVLVVFTGSIRLGPRRWAGAALLTALVLATHLFLPAPRIEEGHNVFLIDGPGGALENGLPREAFRAMAERSEPGYPAAKRWPHAAIQRRRATRLRAVDRPGSRSRNGARGERRREAAPRAGSWRNRDRRHRRTVAAGALAAAARGLSAHPHGLCAPRGGADRCHLHRRLPPARRRR